MTSAAVFQKGVCVGAPSAFATARISDGRDWPFFPARQILTRLEIERRNFKRSHRKTSTKTVGYGKSANLRTWGAPKPRFAGWTALYRPI